MSSILIVTSRSDAHADRLIRFVGNEANIFRWNTEGTNTETQLCFGIDGLGAPFGELTTAPYRALNLREVRSVWYRKPIFDFEIKVSEANRAFALAETRSAIDGFFSLLRDTLWVNDPWVASRARVKAHQLALAKSLGVAVPRTLVTTDFASAMSFVESCPSGAIAKTVYTATASIGGYPQGIPTQIVKPGDLVKWREAVAICPVQFQEYVHKLYELRITVVGDMVFGAKIESQADERTRVDWRPYCDECPHSLVELPEAIQTFCLTLLREQGLAFGAIDMIVTPGERYVFLENNPFGQYLWIEDMTGAPLTKAMADLLTT